MRRATLALVFGLALPLCGLAEEPTLPCKTAQALLTAFQYALEKQDTNLFWPLHCWTNVGPKTEALHKLVTAVYFKQARADEITFSGFKIIQPPPRGYADPVRLRNGAEKRFNIPVTGVITFRTKERRTLTPGTKPLAYSADGEAPFGAVADGALWLAVQVETPGTNAPRKLPPGAITNLFRR